MNASPSPVGDSPAPRRPLNYDGAARYLNTSVRHLRCLVATRRIPYVKLGRLVRFMPDHLDAFLAEQTTDVVR